MASKITEFNLVPVKKRRRTVQINPTVVSVAITVVAGLMVLLALAGITSRRVRTLKNKPASRRTASEATQLARLEEEIDELESQMVTMERLSSGRLPWSDLLIDISEPARERVWFKRLTLDGSTGTCQIGGSSLEAKSVSAFMLALRELPYFDEVSVRYMVEAGKHNQKVVNYEINSKLTELD